MFLRPQQSKKEEIPSEKKALQIIKDHKQTPELIQACIREDFQTMEKLIKAGADVNAVDNQGNTALMHAASHKYDNCLNLLLQACANKDLKNKNGLTAFGLAVYKNRAHHLPLLIDAKQLDKPISNSTSSTPLMVAATLGFDDALNYLITQSTNLDTQDQEGNTALLYATMRNHKECAYSLIQSKANVNLSNKKGRDALDYAIYNKNSDIIALLLEQGASPRSPEALEYFFSISRDTEVLQRCKLAFENQKKNSINKAIDYKR